MTYSRYFIGVDLGQAQDFTAIAVIEEVRECVWHTPETKRWNLRHLERPPLGTSYTDIVADVGRLVGAVMRLSPRCDLVVDATGVGAPVVDLIHAAGLGCPLFPVVITSGDRESCEGGRYRVPKRELVSNLAVMLQDRVLRFAKGLAQGDVLRAELQNFKAKISTSGNDTYEAWREGQHDDLVLAVALACWRADPFGKRAIGFGAKVIF